MAIVDLAHRTITLKVVYYGCALGGKTTNLITLHRLTDPEGEQGLVSIATKDDRTLFFDLLPIDLGQIGGLTVRVKAYTVPGQVHYEVTRRQVLSKTDGVVLVIDSSPDAAKSNAWALENLGYNMKANGLDPKFVPIVLQWNKRDLPDAVPAAKLEAELNQTGLPALESVATTGQGVLETFSTVVKLAMRHACSTVGQKQIAEEELDRMVNEALKIDGDSIPGQPESETALFDRRFDQDAYRAEWAEKGRDRQILDQETLLSEAVQTSMELGEKLDGLRGAREAGERRERMLRVLAETTSALLDVGSPAIPPELMSRLLAAASRSRGSILLFQRDEQVMEEREVVPAGGDPLNGVVAPAVGSAAHRLSQGDSPRLVEDLSAEVFFDAAPPGAADLGACFVAPIVCDRARFGSLVVYGTMGEEPFGSAERDFWSAAAAFLALSLHWRGLRKRLARQAAPAAAGGGG